MYRIEISFPGGEPMHLTARASHEAYRLILSRLQPRCALLVEHGDGQASQGMLRVWLADDRARVRADESQACDPAASGTGTAVEFPDADGSTFSLPAEQTVGRDRALVALADWLDGGQRTGLLSWS